MAINFNSFTEGTTSNIQSNDYVVGFDNTSPGGERKWQLSTIANAVSGLIKTEMANFMNNTLTLGNYPYLEYAWVTAPSAAGQTINTNLSGTVLTLNTEILDTGNFGSISSNQITLSAGTYQFEAYVQFGGTSSLSEDAIIGLTKNGTYVTKIKTSHNGSSGVISGPGIFHPLKGVFQAQNGDVIDLRLATAATFTIGTDLVGGTTFVGGSNEDQRTTIKLWKVG